jgi:hypothetical protein
MEKKLTPAEEMRQFISSKEDQLNMIKKLVIEGYEREMLVNEIANFIDYWSELTKSGKKQRWELQPTFELRRRLGTWLRNSMKFNTKKNAPVADYKEVANELLARRKDAAIKNCGKCKNGFILRNGVMAYCDCVKNLNT